MAYWWQGKPNFGDYMSGVILNEILKNYGEKHEIKILLISAYHTNKNVRKVLALGSILQQEICQDSDVVWGSGILS